MTLCDLLNKTLSLVKTTNSGNIFTLDKMTVLLKPVNRTFGTATKKPLYYLSGIQGGKATYLSGLFATNDASIFSSDYHDHIGLKHIVLVEFSGGGAAVSFKAA